MRFWVRTVCVLAMTLGPVRALAAEGVVPEMRAANGFAVGMPEIDGLDCPGILRGLAAIDATGYRGSAPLSPRHPDYALFIYEDRLAAAFYTRCTLGQGRGFEPGDAFSRGFGAP